MKKTIGLVLVSILLIGAYIVFYHDQAYQDFNQIGVAIYPNVNHVTAITKTTADMSCQISQQQYIGKVYAYRKIKCASGVDGFVLESQLSQ